VNRTPSDVSPLEQQSAAEQQRNYARSELSRALAIMRDQADAMRALVNASPACDEELVRALQNSLSGTWAAAQEQFEVLATAIDTERKVTSARAATNIETLEHPIVPERRTGHDRRLPKSQTNSEHERM
jgi:hypothetical protein